MKRALLKKNELTVSRIVKNQSCREYSRFDQVDGSHSYKSAVPDGYIEYRVRTRKGGSVFYFNFKLAKQMGLIPQDHDEVLTSALSRKILDTFSLVIINEYDLNQGIVYPEKEIRPNTYMATRYLQLQHPNKQGKTSGDGRGIWNGEIEHRGITWDISSSGTGATRLSPAFAQTNEFIKTGDPEVCYGNGYNELCDGLSAALLSAIFHERGIETEQTLALIAFQDGTSINVRASKNLLRPAHFFHFLKKGDLKGLRASVDYFINRELKNQTAVGIAFNDPKVKYQKFAEQMALIFSKLSATFEAEYIFCWLEWDGDNILANGGIIDYGSIRQFGLYHKEYRYDDVTRFSTTIPEQKRKARYMVQTFAQMKDFLMTGKKRNIQAFSHDPLIALFNQNFKKVLHHHLLKKMGLNAEQTEFLLLEHHAKVKKLKWHHEFFEKTQSYRKKYKIPDGITRDAVFCMRSLHRELPRELSVSSTPLSAEALLRLMKSSYAKPKDLKLNRTRVFHAQALQKTYLQILQAIAKRFYEGNLKKALLAVMMRASVMNPLHRITGDGVLHVTGSLLRNKKKLNFEQMNQVIHALVQQQLAPSVIEARMQAEIESPIVKKIVFRNIKAIQKYRHGY